MWLVRGSCSTIGFKLLYVPFDISFSIYFVKIQLSFQVDQNCLVKLAEKHLPMSYEDWADLKEDKRHAEIIQYLKKLTPEQREEKLKKNNFHMFLQFLESEVGKKKQKELLIKMIKRQMNRVAVEGLQFADLIKFHSRSRQLCDGVDIGTRFREIFEKSGGIGLQLFRYAPTEENATNLKSKIFDLLNDYLNFIDNNSKVCIGKVSGSSGYRFVLRGVL